jgi:hypothetical protein
LVLDKKADYEEWSNNVKRAIKGRMDQMLEGTATREDLSID